MHNRIAASAGAVAGAAVPRHASAPGARRIRAGVAWRSAEGGQRIVDALEEDQS